MNVLALSVPVVESDREKALRAAEQALDTLPIKRLITDYTPGWSLILTQAAKDRGIAYFGALPYPITDEEATPLMDKAKSNIVFNDKLFDYYINAQPYITWVLNNTDIGLSFLPEGVSCFSQRIAVELRHNGKQVFNLYGGQ